MVTFRTFLRASFAVAAFLTLAPTASAEPRWDETFGSAGRVDAKSILNEKFGIADVATLRNGGVAVAGVSRYGRDTSWKVRVLTPRGEPDRRYGVGGLVRFPRAISDRLIFDHDLKLRVQRDGKLLIIGPANVGNRRDRLACRCDGIRQGWGVIRILRSGKLDRSYGSGGLALLRGVDAVVTDWDGTSTPPPVDAAALAPDGALLVYGTSYEAVVLKKRFSRDTRPGILIRVDPGGEQDRSFGAGGRVYQHGFREQWADSMNVRRDGTIVTTRLRLVGGDHLGSKAAVYIRRYDRHGERLRGKGHNDSYTRARIWSGDRMYGSASTHVDTRGRVLVEIGYGDNSYDEDFELRRFAADGKPDRTFSGDGRLPIRPAVAPFGNLVNAALVVSANGSRMRLLINLWDRRAHDMFDLPSLLRVSESGSVVPSATGAVTHMPPLAAKDYSAESAEFDRDGRLVVIGSMNSRDGTNTLSSENLIARLLGS